jgi:hypothetical protein
LNAEGRKVRRPYLLSLLALVTACEDGLPSLVATETIGPEGGDVRLQDFVLSIPEGALVAPMDVTVRRTSDGIPSDFSSTSPLYAIEPRNLELYRPAGVAIRSDADAMSEVMWASGDETLFQHRPGTRGPDYVSALGWRLGDVFAGKRTQCDSPTMVPSFVPSDPMAAVRSFGWSLSDNGVRNRLVVAEQLGDGTLQIEEFDAETLAFVRRTPAGVALGSVAPAIDRHEVAVFAATDQELSIVGIDEAGQPTVSTIAARGSPVRLEVRGRGKYTELEVFSRGPGTTLFADHLLLDHDRLVPVAVDDYLERSVTLSETLVDVRGGSGSCGQESFVAVLARHVDGTGAIVQFAGSLVAPQLTEFGPLGTDLPGSVATFVETDGALRDFDETFGDGRATSSGASARWLVPRSSGAPLATHGYTSAADEVALSPGGALTAVDVDGDLLPELLRVDANGGLEFVNRRTGVVGSWPPVSVGGAIRSDVRVGAAIDLDADLCVRRRSTNRDFAVATENPAGLIVYRPQC